MGYGLQAHQAWLERCGRIHRASPYQAGLERPARLPTTATLSPELVYIVRTRIFWRVLTLEELSVIAERAKIAHDCPSSFTIAFSIRFGNLTVLVSKALVAIPPSEFSGIHNPRSP